MSWQSGDTQHSTSYATPPRRHGGAVLSAEKGLEAIWSPDSWLASKGNVGPSTHLLFSTPILFPGRKSAYR